MKYLGLYKNQIDEQYDKVMLDILVAEAAAVATHGESDIVSAGLVPCARVCRPERLDRVPALNTNGHDRYVKQILMSARLL